MQKIKVNGYTLDEEQTKPIIENPKYSIIIAGAGSGKTLTLVGKIKFLLENNIYKENEILCLSFTNEATTNLKNSILKNTGKEIDTLTFHKLALKILSLANLNYGIVSDDYLSYIVDELFQSYFFGNDLLKDAFLKHNNIYFFKEKRLKELLESNDINKLKKTIITFINLFANNNKDKYAFYEFIKTTKKKHLLQIIYAIYTIYLSEKESTGQIDFDDMIKLATNILTEKTISLPYKMIIIDEFQDTSIVRFNLIKKIVAQNDASLCVVGDDYQSIYHFSGCDLELFLNFTKMYKDAKLYFLNSTYRNSNELIKTLGNFIMKNNSQIKKTLKSNKTYKKPIKIVYYKNEDTILKKVLKKIPQTNEVFILGRNKMDIKKYTKTLPYKEDNHHIYFKNDAHSIRYLTIHASKGLESDTVIILNVSNTLYGIPSKVEDESILKLVKKTKPFPYEEERRLFYVALTRTKNEVYLLVDENSPSCFIKEIKKSTNTEIIHL